jgi:hypothetical protein
VHGETSTGALWAGSGFFSGVAAVREIIDIVEIAQARVWATTAEAARDNASERSVRCSC